MAVVQIRDKGDSDYFGDRGFEAFCSQMETFFVIKLLYCIPLYLNCELNLIRYTDKFCITIEREIQRESFA